MSNRGFLVFAAGEKYVKQAYLLALSIKKNSIYPISIVTNDRVPYTIFDNIIPHTFNASGRFVTDVRKHAYDLTPYSETIVLDTDTIVLQNLDYFWNIKKNSFYYTTNAFTYRNELITSDYYRKTFTANNLPNCYNAFYYFKKDETAKRFYELVSSIFDNWTDVYNICCPNYTPDIPSMDVTTAIALKMVEYSNSLSAPFLVHMKPAIQNWNTIPEQWTDKVNLYVDKHAHVKIANYKQTGILHYVENIDLDTTIRKFENA